MSSEISISETITKVYARIYPSPPKCLPILFIIIIIIIVIMKLKIRSTFLANLKYTLCTIICRYYTILLDLLILHNWNFEPFA